MCHMPPPPQCRRRCRQRCPPLLLRSCAFLPACQDIAPFEDPKIDLEQYPTGAHLASRLLYTVRRAAPAQQAGGTAATKPGPGRLCRVATWAAL